jgi:hypothetical protein
VRGYDSELTNQVAGFLIKYLNDEPGSQVTSMLNHWYVFVIATDRPLPHTGAMALIPICRNTRDFERNREKIAERMREIVKAVHDGTMQRLLDASDTLPIQPGISTSASRTGALRC